MRKAVKKPVVIALIGERVLPVDVEKLTDGVLRDIADHINKHEAEIARQYAQGRIGPDVGFDWYMGAHEPRREK